MFKKKEAARVREYGFFKKNFRAITGQQSNVILQNNTNHVCSILNKTNIDPKLSQDWKITPRNWVREKTAEVIGTLPKKFNLHIAVHDKSERKKNELSKKEKGWINNFLERSDINYTIPGRRDTVYVGMDGGKRKYKQKRYLLWNLCDLLKINRSKMYNFLIIHKEVA